MKFMNKYPDDEAPAGGIPRYGKGATPLLRDVSRRRVIPSVHSRNTSQPPYDWANEDDAPSMMADHASPHGISRTKMYDQDKEV